LNYITGITLGFDRILWFTTEFECRYLYDSYNWLNFRKIDGLPFNWLDAVPTAPDGSLWFGARKGGIARFGP